MSGGKRFADMNDDERFEVGGGFDFADKVSAGLRERAMEAMSHGQVSVGVMANTVELVWLLDAYEKARGRPIPAAGSSASGTPRTEENRDG